MLIHTCTHKSKSTQRIGTPCTSLLATRARDREDASAGDGGDPGCRARGYGRTPYGGYTLGARGARPIAGRPLLLFRLCCLYSYSNTLYAYIPVRNSREDPRRHGVRFTLLSAPSTMCLHGTGGCASPLQLLNVNVNGSHSSAKFWSQCRLLRWRSRRTVTNCIHFWFRAPRLNHRRQQSTCCCRLTHSISMLDRAACGLRVEGGRRSAGALLTRALQGISTRTRYLRRNLRSIYKRGGPQALAARLVRLP